MDYGPLATVVLVIFVAIRVLIAAGLVYLIYYEVKRFRRPKKDKEAKDGTKDGEHTGITYRD